MGNFNLAYQFVRGAEGGYSNQNYDRGGETNYGITRNVFLDAKNKGIINKDIKSIKHITPEDAKAIYKQLYWDMVHGDDLPRGIAIALFDRSLRISGLKTAYSPVIPERYQTSFCKTPPPATA